MGSQPFSIFTFQMLCPLETRTEGDTSVFCTANLTGPQKCVRL